MTHHDILSSLRAAYDAGAAEQDSSRVSAWKIRERDTFLELLQERGSQTLLELGSGPGRDVLFFGERGLTVV